MPHPDQRNPKRAVPGPRRRMPAWVSVLVGVAVTGIVVLVVVVSSLRTGTSPNEAERGLLNRRHENTAPAVQPGRGVVAAVAPNTPSAKPLAASVANRVKAAGAAPGVLGADIRDAATGETLYQSGQSTLLTPASNLKVCLLYTSDAADD